MSNPKSPKMHARIGEAKNNGAWIEIINYNKKVFYKYIYDIIYFSIPYQKENS